MSLKVCIAGASVSGRSQESNKVLLSYKLINPAGWKGPQEVSSHRTAIEMFNLVNVRRTMFREIFPFFKESSLLLLGGGAPLEAAQFLRSNCVTSVIRQ